MGFVEPIPPLLEKALNEIENHNGQVTHKEFKKILYKLRISSKDVLYYKNYLQSADKIEIDTRKIKLKEINDIEKINLLKCPECGYEWNYRGISKRAKCPACEYRDKKYTWLKVTHSKTITTHSI